MQSWLLDAYSCVGWARKCRDPIWSQSNSKLRALATLSLWPGLINLCKQQLRYSSYLLNYYKKHLKVNLHHYCFGLAPQLDHKSWIASLTNPAPPAHTSISFGHQRTSYRSKLAFPAQMCSRWAWWRILFVGVGVWSPPSGVRWRRLCTCLFLASAGLSCRSCRLSLLRRWISECA